MGDCIAQSKTKRLHEVFPLIGRQSSLYVYLDDVWQLKVLGQSRPQAVQNLEQFHDIIYNIAQDPQSGVLFSAVLDSKVALYSFPFN